jgi:hypothetical protein
LRLRWTYIYFSKFFKLHIVNPSHIAHVFCSLALLLSCSSALLLSCSPALLLSSLPALLLSNSIAL